MHEKKGNPIKHGIRRENAPATGEDVGFSMCKVCTVRDCGAEKTVSCVLGEQNFDGVSVVKDPSIARV